jgi:hypothetical protein
MNPVGKSWQPLFQLKVQSPRPDVETVSGEE